MSVVFTCIQLRFAAEICSYSAWLNTPPNCVHALVLQTETLKCIVLHVCICARVCVCLQ